VQAQLRDSRFPFVQLLFEDTHLASVVDLKSGELAARIDKLKFALTERRVDRGQLPR
jgi:hypothetical protein